MGFIGGQHLQPSAHMFGPRFVDVRPSAAQASMVLAISPDRDALLIDFGYVVRADLPATTVISGVAQLGLTGDLDKFWTGQVPAGLAAGKVRSIGNRGLSWATAGEARQDRVIPAGTALWFEYAGGSVSDGRYIFWVRLEPYPLVKGVDD